MKRIFFNTSVTSFLFHAIMVDVISLVEPGQVLQIIELSLIM